MKKSVLFITVLVFILFACRQDKLDVDVSEIEVKPLQLLRLEDDLFALTSANFDVQSPKITEKYGHLYEQFLVDPLRIRGTRDTAYKAMVLDFTGDRDTREAYSYVKKLYTPTIMQEITSELDKCIKRFKHHFPERKLPERLVTCTTGWNYAFAYLDNSFLVGLDMYLGDTAKFYQMLRMPQYQVRRMNRAHLLPDIARGWILTGFDNNAPENNLLSHTIFYGKLYYAIQALLPGVQDSLLIGYTGRQISTCRQYEKNYWSYFAEKNRLYENNMNTIRELTSEGPFTAAISKECPPRIAMWIGWQIVRSYMKHNETVTLAELMAETDARKILSKSKYRP